MGLLCKNIILNTPVNLIWWRRDEYKFTPDEQVLIRGFTQIGTYDALAKQLQCTTRTIRNRMTPIFAKIGTKDRQTALDIFHDFEAPIDFVMKEGVNCEFDRSNYDEIKTGIKI